MTDKPRVFISYRRSDGEEFATQLRKRLEREEPEITLWQDRARMEGGVGWWKQITDALDAVQFMVLVMTPDAIESEVVRKEWRYARQQGVCIYPVKGAPDLDFDRLPRWIRDVHFYDLDREWETFVRHLKSPCQVTRVPFMAPDLPEGFIERPAEFEELVGYLLDKDRQNPVAITTALHGAGGFGKTTLAAALCHDDDVMTAFDDGILWVTLSQAPDMVAALTTLYAALTGERPGFATEEDAATALTERLSEKDCLMVIDDVWNAVHLRPFLRGGERCARLITTRQFDIAAEARRVDVDEMATDEAAQMLTARLEAPPDDLEPFWALARRLGEWPLMLELAGAALRQRLARGDTLEGALAYLNKALDKRGVVAFDQRNAEERNQAIAKSIAVSMDLLTEDEREHYLQLAIFPENTDVSLSAVGALWDLDDFDTEEQAQRLDDLSLLKFDLQAGTVRLHDVMRAYLANQLADPAGLHAALLEAWGDPHHLPDDYAWRWVAYHLKEAGRAEALRALLCDFDWLQAKLDATDVNALIVDYDFTLDDADLRLVQGTIRLAAHVLARDKTQLAGQLLGRLLGQEMPVIQTMLEQTKEWRAVPWLLPLTPSLTPPGGPLIRTLQGHTDAVYACAVTPDGKKVVSASQDGTLRVWELATGREIVTMAVGWSVHGCAVTPDGKRVISFEEWRPPRVWDLITGEEVLTLEGETRGKVYSCAMTPDGSKLVVRYVVSRYDEDTRLWDLINGRELHTFDKAYIWDLIEKRWQHFYYGSDQHHCAITPDGTKVISGTFYGTLIVCDRETGRELMTLKGHADAVSGCTVTPDNKYLISASWDETLKVWDLTTGSEIATLSDHNFRVSDCKITPNGKYFISASWDTTLKVWDLERVGEPQPKRSHQDEVNRCMVTPDGKKAISASADGTSKIWDIETGVELASLQGYGCAMTPDGQKVVSAGRDGALRIWDIEAGVELATLEGRGKFVAHDCVVTPDGDSIISWSGGLLKVWDIASQRERFTLKGVVKRCNVTPDSTKAILKFDEFSIVVLNLADGEVLLTLTDKDIINDCTITPDGKHIISASSDNSLKIWDLETGELITTLVTTFRSPVDKLVMCTISPDGKHLVSVSVWGAMQIWDCATWREVATLQGHKVRLFACTFTPDGKYVVSGSLDRTLRVWSVADGREVSRLEGVASFASIAVAPNGRDIIACDSLGNVHFLEFNPGRFTEK